MTLTPVSGQVNTYDMVRADSPEQTGTPLNTENLLSQRASATILTLAGVEPENPSEAFIQLSKVLYPLKKEAVGIASGSYTGTGASSGTFLTETFEFTPMVVIVIDSTAAAGTSSNPAALYTFFAVQGASQLSRLDHNGYETPVDVTWDDYTITLANGTGLNTSGHIYKWVVIGQIPDTGVIDEDEIDWEAAVLALIDPTLTESDHAADAKAVGDAIGDLSDLETTDKTNLVAAINEANQNGGTTGTTVPAEVRQAILTLFEAAAYASADVSAAITTVRSWAMEITAIEISQSAISISGSNTAQLVATTTPAGGTVTWASSNTAVATVSSSGLVTGVGNGTARITARCGDLTATCTATVSGFATLTGITATYTQSGTVYDTDSLSDLVSDLVVVANYDNSSTVTLTSDQYTLSGTLSEGTSTITVSYGGMVATFTVVVSVIARYTMSVTTELATKVARDGTVSSVNNSIATDYIELDDMWNLISVSSMLGSHHDASGWSGAFYNESKQYLSGWDNYWWVPVSVPQYAKYIRISFDKTQQITSEQVDFYSFDSDQYTNISPTMGWSAEATGKVAGATVTTTGGDAFVALDVPTDGKNGLYVDYSSNYSYINVSFFDSNNGYISNHNSGGVSAHPVLYSIPSNAASFAIQAYPSVQASISPDSQITVYLIK